jgi:DNA-binding transcriptional ArsR family regulator
MAAIGALIGDPARARMLSALMDGRALTATELGLDAGVAPSTASSHLARLTRGGLVVAARQGRHRYFRIADREIAEMLEGLMSLASGRGRPRRTGPSDVELRRARVCYDHLAGEYGVRLFESLRRRRLVDEGRDGDLRLTRSGEKWAGTLGLDVSALRAQRRPLLRTCLDWSERRFHLAGAFGAALLERLLALRYVRRDPVGRALTLSPRGSDFFAALGVRDEETDAQRTRRHG